VVWTVRRRVGGKHCSAHRSPHFPVRTPTTSYYYVIPDRASHYSTSGGNRKVLEDILAPLLCEVSRLPNHTEGGLAFSRLPAPQR
jgi:hypothetical protein